LVIVGKGLKRSGAGGKEEGGVKFSLVKRAVGVARVEGEAPEAGSSHGQKSTGAWKLAATSIPQVGNQVTMVRSRKRKKLETSFAP